MWTSSSFGCIARSLQYFMLHACVWLSFNVREMTSCVCVCVCVCVLPPSEDRVVSPPLRGRVGNAYPRAVGGLGSKTCASRHVQWHRNPPRPPTTHLSASAPPPVAVVALENNAPHTSCQTRREG